MRLASYIMTGQLAASYINEEYPLAKLPLEEHMTRIRLMEWGKSLVDSVKGRVYTWRGLVYSNLLLSIII